MSAFSIETALTAGVPLIRREWKAVLAWGAVYLAAIFVAELLVFAPPAIAAIGNGGAILDAVRRVTPEAAWPRIVLGQLLILTTLFILHGGLARAHLRPEDRGRLFLRLSRQELWLGLSTTAVLVIGLAAAAALTGGLLWSFRLLRGEDHPLLVALALGVPAFVGCVYVGMRLSLTWLIAWEESRFVLFDSWRLTRGHGWRLVLLFITVLGMAALILVGFGFIAWIIGSIIVLATKAMEPLAIALAVMGAPAIIVAYVVLISWSMVLCLSPFVEVYRGLRDARAAEDGPGWSPA